MTETNAPKLVISLWALVSISLVFVALRLLCKGRYSKGYCWDDYLLTAAWISFSIYATIITISTTHGYGRHLTDIPPADLVKAVKVLYIGQTFAGIGLATSKVSFAVTLLRLVQRRWQKWLLWFLLVSMILAWSLIIIFTFAACTPVEKLWDNSVQGTCWDAHSLIGYSIFVGSYSAALDMLLALLPSMIIWKIRISEREKAGVIVCMSLGFLAGIVAAMKTSSIMNIAIWRDYTYSGVILLIWAAAEISMTIIALSIPYFRLAIKKASGRLDGHNSRGHAMDGFSERRTSMSGAATTATMPDDGSEEVILAQTKEGKIMQMSVNEIEVMCNDGD